MLKVYRRGEKFLVLNPSMPSWVVTNLNGVLTIKLFGETQSVEETVCEVVRQASFPPLDDSAGD